ncbi:MAG: alpha-2-macroglobulin [Chloroflexi bacterium]|nr:alpha-2-macroglobulin [Chloroflexota bacterium]
MLISTILLAALLAPLISACIQKVEGSVDGYTAVLPAVIQSGSTQNISLSLFRGDQLASDTVELALLKGQDKVADSTARVDGKGTVRLDVPPLEDGEYTVRLKGSGFQDEAKVKVDNSYLVFLETDKPIYKPGQTVHMRVISLSPELKPVSEKISVEVMDAKGTKVFRKAIDTDDYGTVTLDLPVSAEPNLGVWKIAAAGAKAKTQLDVRIEEYVLPKYEVKVDLPKEWFLVNEPITGKISAEYSFGKQVNGDLEIKASRYVGQWQDYATYTVPIDGQSEFTIPAAGYVAAVPAAGGQGNIMLNVSVIEEATGYNEKTSRMLTVAQSPTNLQVIPSGSMFKPGIPFSFLLVTKTPDGRLVEAKAKVRISYVSKEFKEIGSEDKTTDTIKGKALLQVTPPVNAVAMSIEASTPDARASKTVQAGYSPSGNFIHVEQTSEGTAALGQTIAFKVYSTKEASNFYYEVISRGKVVFSDFTRGDSISFKTTPAMAPTSKLLVYQILPNAEVAADYIPFKVDAQYPQAVKVDFSKPEARPGEDVTISVQTDGQAKVGLAAVDKSVFILAENRLNLQQVFDELEKLYMKPQVEIHEVSPLYRESVAIKGSRDVFKDAGAVVISNKSIPEGAEYKNKNMPRPMPLGGVWKMADQAASGARGAVPPVPAAAPVPEASHSGLAEVKRVRQFFPETWIWQELTTDASGKGAFKVKVPDSITTWMLRAVALSKSKGLGIAESQLRSFQPFFLSVDLPYSAIRGEEFPAKIAIYNYLDTSQSVTVKLDTSPWFDLLDKPEKTVDIKANDIGGVQFMIRPKKLGVNDLKVTAQSKQDADAVIKTLMVESEGTPRELVDNLILSGGGSKAVDTSVPPQAIDDSARAYLTLTSSYLAQTIDGLEGLLQMPFGCGEQNMIVFAPDVFITKYLKQSGQLKPEVMAKAEKLMLTGYQRELTYRRSDGSFSAFGQQDKEGSLWLTSFVLKSFAQASDLIFIDDNVLAQAQSWIKAHQNADGSFDAVGFVIHKEMMGGLQGKTAMSSYVAIALMQAGEKVSSARAVSYLEGKLSDITDSYTAALAAYALELGNSPKAADAYNKLMKMAKDDENGLHWGGVQPGEPGPMPMPKLVPGMPGGYMPAPRTSDIEATGYATLALVKHGDAANAGKAARWLVSKRNAYGGFGSTQDTVVGLEALTSYATGVRADVDLIVTVEAGGKTQEVRVRSDNFDVLQIVELPVNSQVNIKVAGKGDAVAQVVRRFNLPETKKAEEAMKVDVSYDVTRVAVNDLVKVSVKVAFNPPFPVEAGMTVVDISVPTGFAPVSDSIAAAVKAQKKLQRFDISGRKVILYIENMMPGDTLAFSFDVKAMYPVKAKGTSSKAYSYYRLELSGETMGQDMVVVDR